MTRYTIDPANFTDGQWEEFYNASTIMPRTYEARHNAKPFRRPKKYIRLSIEALYNRASEVRDVHSDEPWAADLEAAAETLSNLIGDVESCPKCGDTVTRGAAFEDQGEGEESGRTFYYCSEHCRETH